MGAQARSGGQGKVEAQLFLLKADPWEQPSSKFSGERMAKTCGTSVATYAPVNHLAYRLGGRLSENPPISKLPIVPTRQFPSFRSAG